MRFRLDLAYDGTDFHGWAAQPGLRTVEGTLSDAIGAALPLVGCPSGHELVVAGRTDAGVHARAQVAHLDAAVDAGFAPELRRHVARLLPPDVALHTLTPARDGFDARFSATSRTYCYRLWDEASSPQPVLRWMVAQVPWRLDVDAMAGAATSLLGLHDFAAFCRPREGATTVRELRRAEVARGADGMIECRLTADAFCHSMVRSLVGALVAVGAGRRDAGWVASLLDRDVRANDVTVMPACGLTLEAVDYPPDDQLAARAQQARNRRDCPEGGCE